MKAVRVSRGTVHLLSDEQFTLCGKDLDLLDIVGELELDSLPSVEGCGNCRRNSEGWSKPKTQPLDERWYRTALPASKGRISTQGPLRHTGRSGHGRPLR